MIRFLLLILVSWVAASIAGAASSAYDFPFKDPLLATVLGTPKDLRAEIDFDVPRREQKIVVFPEREIPTIVPRSTYRYAITVQDRPAPLIFVIAGTGSSHRGAKMKMLEAVFFGAGFHVVSLSSPTYANFIMTASSTHIPGRTGDDAADLYRVMEAIWDEHKDRIEVTAFHVTGFSLGGTNAAFVALLDEQRKTFNFEKVLMINPPLSLYSSVRILDRMLDENIPGPAAPDFDTFFNRVMERFTEVYAANKELNFNDEFLYQIYQLNVEAGHAARQEDLEALIGASFRLSSANMITTADYAARRGFIISKDHELGLTETTTPIFKVAVRTSFSDYIDDMYIPFFQEKSPQFSREDLIREASLESIESFLRRADNVAMMHNVDDVIMADGEIDYLRDVFGPRAKIYPKGGHCGNMDHRDNVAFMIDFFTGEGLR